MRDVLDAEDGADQMVGTVLEKVEEESDRQRHWATFLARAGCLPGFTV